jgi:hypothetical protein
VGGGPGDGKGAGAPLPAEHEVADAFAERRRRFVRPVVDWLAIFVGLDV